MKAPKRFSEGKPEVECDESFFCTILAGIVQEGKVLVNM